MGLTNKSVNAALAIIVVTCIVQADVVVSQTVGSTPADAPPSPSEYYKQRTPQLIAGKLLKGLMTDVEECSKMNGTECEKFLVGEKMTTLNGMPTDVPAVTTIPDDVVKVFSDEGRDSMRTTQYDYKRQALKFFTLSMDCVEADATALDPVANNSEPGQCYTALEDLSADKYVDVLKKQLEAEYSLSFKMNELLKAVEMAGILAPREGGVGRLSDPGGYIVLTVTAVILLVGAVAVGLGYHLGYLEHVKKMLQSSKGGGEKEREQLLGMIPGLPPPKFPARPGIISGAARPAKEKEPASEELRSKLTRLREQRAKELRAHAV